MSKAAAPTPPPSADPSGQDSDVAREQFEPLPAGLLDSEGVVPDLVVVGDPRADVGFHALVTEIDEDVLDYRDALGVHELNGLEDLGRGACPIPHRAIPSGIVGALADPELDERLKFARAVSPRTVEDSRKLCVAGSHPIAEQLFEELLPVAEEPVEAPAAHAEPSCK